LGAGDEGVDYCGVPARVNDGDAEGGACTWSRREGIGRPLVL